MSSCNSCQKNEGHRTLSVLNQQQQRTQNTCCAQSTADNNRGHRTLAVFNQQLATTDDTEHLLSSTNNRVHRTLAVLNQQQQRTQNTCCPQPTTAKDTEHLLSLSTTTEVTEHLLSSINNNRGHRTLAVLYQQQQRTQNTCCPLSITTEDT